MLCCLSPLDLLPPSPGPGVELGLLARLPRVALPPVLLGVRHGADLGCKQTRVGGRQTCPVGRMLLQAEVTKLLLAAHTRIQMLKNTRLV